MAATSRGVEFGRRGSCTTKLTAVMAPWGRGTVGEKQDQQRTKWTQRGFLKTLEKG